MIKISQDGNPSQIAIEITDLSIVKNTNQIITSCI